MSIQSIIGVAQRKGSARTVRFSIEGKVAWFEVGKTGRMVKFLIHSDSPKLTHFASGQLVGDFGALRALAHHSYVKMRDRYAAEIMLDRLCENLGDKTVLQRLIEAPVIND